MDRLFKNLNKEDIEKCSNLISKITASDIMIPTSKLYVTDPDKTIGYAKLKMVRNNIGSLLVVKDDVLVGIITHRDANFLGDDAVELSVKDIMSKELEVVSPESSIREVVDIMLRKGYQRVPVLENGKLVGLITQGSVIRALSNILNVGS
ncbi:MAG: cyclic nucleotide-binding/CBS domain-containing protein [Candidatus Hydrothermarchaeota archaeon]